MGSSSIVFSCLVCLAYCFVSQWYEIVRELLGDPAVHSTFLCAPWQVSYIVFIVLYGYIITKNFPPYDPDKPLGGLSYIEILLYFWILTLFLEEVRQVGENVPVMIRSIFYRLVIGDSRRGLGNVR